MKNKLTTIGVVVSVIILLLFGKCQSDSLSKLKGEYKALEEESKKAKDGVKVFEESRLREKDLLTKEINKRDKKIADAAINLENSKKEKTF